MTFDRLLGEALHDAARAVEERIRVRELEIHDGETKLRMVGEIAADFVAQRCPRVLERMNRDRLVEIAIAEIGN